ncbi:MAG: site-specific integrase, partial [Actinobacteria bacterium]|nr:site-specific integrase [Actinomycetota bacterium]
MSIAKRPSGKWRAQFHEFPGGPRRTKVFDRKGDAQRWLDEQRVNIARGEYVDPTRARQTTFDAHATAWMAAQPWRGSTRDKTESMYRTHIEPKFGVRPIGSLRTSELQAWATGLGATLAP